MPLIDQLVETLHNMHLPHVERAEQLYASISAPPELGLHYLAHLRENSPALAAELDEQAQDQLLAALAAMYGVIQLLNHCASNFPFGRVLPRLPFVAENRQARAAQETLLDKMVHDYGVPAISEDENAEVVLQNRLQMIREMLLA